MRKVEADELGVVGTSTSLVKPEESACDRGQRYMAPRREMIGEIDPLISPGPKAEIVLIKGLIRSSHWGAEWILPTGISSRDGKQIARCWPDDPWAR